MTSGPVTTTTTLPTNEANEGELGAEAALPAEQSPEDVDHGAAALAILEENRRIDNYAHPPHMPYKIKLTAPELIHIASGNEHVIANKILAHIKRKMAGRAITIRRS